MDSVLGILSTNNWVERLRRKKAFEWRMMPLRLLCRLKWKHNQKLASRMHEENLNGPHMTFYVERLNEESIIWYWINLFRPRKSNDLKQLIDHNWLNISRLSRAEFRREWLVSCRARNYLSYAICERLVFRQEYVNVVNKYYCGEVCLWQASSKSPCHRKSWDWKISLRGAIVSVGYQREKRRCLPSNGSWLQKKSSTAFIIVRCTGSSQGEMLLFLIDIIYEMLSQPCMMVRNDSYIYCLW